MLDKEYYNRFPEILKKALISGKVSFPYTIQKDYGELCAYRGVRYNSNKTVIDKSDFFSQMELKSTNPMVVADDTNVSDYSCSCFLNMEEMRVIAKFPRKNKAIAKGVIKKNFGPIAVNDDTSHVDLFLYEDVDPSGEFEVIEIWQKNG